MPNAQDVLTADDAPRDFPGADAADDALLRHIVSVGGLWFAAAVVAAAVGLAGLLAAGWRPSDLHGAGDALWWTGAAVAAGGIGALAWAGCPVVVPESHPATERKSLSIRAGVVAFLVGAVCSGLAVLLA
jgi:hypothetical protein